MRKLVKISGIITIILIVALAVLFKQGSPYLILKPFRNHLDKKPSDYGLLADTLNVKTKEGYRLKGFLIKPKIDSPKAVIIMLHGISGYKEGFLKAAQEMANEGIASVIFDQRGHGESEGEYCTYGFYEKQDVSKIIDFVKMSYPNQTMGIWGSSLGGAVAIQALEYDKRLNFGIIESTFTDLDAIVYDYMQHRLGFRNRFLAHWALLEAGKIGNFEPNQVKPIESVKHIAQPIFIAHGDKDERIKVGYGQQLYENAASKDKTLEIIQGAGHHNLSSIGGEAYAQKINQFIKKK